MTYQKNIIGMSGAQLANGTPSDKVLILKSFFKGDRCTISPAKDQNGRYLGINENIPEIKKLEMGYVPSPESRIKLYDDMKVDLNNPQWIKDWEWMKYCDEIADDFATGQASPKAYFYINRPGVESAKAVAEATKLVELQNYILTDSPENLYNRVSILGMDMSGSIITDVKEYLLGLVVTEPAKIRQVYESKTFSLELLLMHAIQREVISKRGGVYIFGEALLGVEKSAVVAFFANPKNNATTKAIEAVTYGTFSNKINPLEDESVAVTDTIVDEDHIEDIATSTAEGVPTSSFTEPEEKVLTPQQKAAITRKRNQGTIGKNKK